VHGDGRHSGAWLMETSRGDLGWLDVKLGDERCLAMAGGDLERLDSKAGDEHRSATDDGRRLFGELGPSDC
jgi:hypothetical protein